MNGSSQWRPLSKRGDEAVEDEVPYEGIPDHMQEPIANWFEHWSRSFGGLHSIYLLLRWTQESSDLSDDFGAMIFSDAEAALDAIDAALMLRTRSNSSYPMVKQMKSILTLGGSAWQVSSNGRSLERRVEQTAGKAFAKAKAGRSGASEYLAEAWHLTYGRNPNPSSGYNAAIKAVEAAAVPIVSPKNKRSTLGTIIRDLEAAPQKWQLSITRSDGKEDLGPLLEPMRLLWHGQTDRHGSGSKPVRVTPEAATAAVNLAVMLVNWFQSGLIIQRS